MEGEVIEAALFDMGDTLITGFGDGDVGDVCRALAVELPQHEYLLHEAGKLFEDERKRNMETFEQRSFDEIYFAMCRKMFGRIDIGEEKKILNLVFRRLTKNAALYPETLEVLGELHQYMKLGIVSNVGFLEWRYKELLTRKQVLWYFDASFFSSTYRIRKPNPALFTSALRWLDVEPHNVIHVGDKLDRDIAGAHAAGIRAIWLNRDGRKRKRSEPRPDWIAHDLRDVLCIIDGMNDTFA